MDLTELSPKIFRLPSGLCVIITEMPGLHRVVIDTHLRVGSRFETPEVNGISHFLEHMIYRGTPHHPSAEQLALAFEQLGGMLVATTATDSGSLTIGMPLENFEPVLGLYAQVFQSPILGGIEIERGIVTEEILESLDDRGRAVDADNLIRSLVFPDHPLGFPITGTVEHLQSFDRDLLLAHHAKHYTGVNAVLAVAGPISSDRVMAQVEAAFANLSRGVVPQVAAPNAQLEPRFSFVKHPSSQTALRVAFRAPKITDADEPATDLLLRMIDDGMSTRLYRRICDNRGLCYDVSAGYEAYHDSGLFEFRAESAPERSSAVLAEILAIASDLRISGPTEAELAKAKQRHRWQLNEMLDHPESVTAYYALSELSGVLRAPLERQSELEQFDCARLKAAAQRLFRRSSLSVLAVGVLSKREQRALERQLEEFPN